jgi:dTMP kinase
MTKGFLIVVEGIDGTGKTTQCERLAERLRDAGWDVVRLREPTDGPCGRRIRELARSGRDDVTMRDELDLFIEDRREDVRDNIQPALERGAIIVLDRYFYSTIAYQGARGLDPAMIRRENEAFAPPADLLLHLTMPVEMAAERIEGARGGELDLFEREDYLRKVAEVFDALPDPQIVRIDAAATPNAVFQAMWDAVRVGMEERQER